MDNLRSLFIYSLCFNGLFGVFIERVFLRPLTKKGGGYTVAGMGIIICGWSFSSFNKRCLFNLESIVAKPFPAELGLPMEIGGLFLPITYIWMIVVGLSVAAGLWFFLNKTKMGLGIRAVAYSKDVSNLVGINVPLYISIIFGIACAIAGIGGTLVGPSLSSCCIHGLYHSYESFRCCGRRWFW